MFFLLIRAWFIHSLSLLPHVLFWASHINPPLSCTSRAPNAAFFPPWEIIRRTRCSYASLVICCFPWWDFKLHAEWGLASWTADPTAPHLCLPCSRNPLNTGGLGGQTNEGPPSWLLGIISSAISLRIFLYLFLSLIPFSLLPVFSDVSFPVY